MLNLFGELVIRLNRYGQYVLYYESTIIATSDSFEEMINNFPTAVVKFEIDKV